MAAVGPGGGVISKQPIKTSRRRYFQNGCRVEACGPLQQNHCIQNLKSLHILEKLVDNVLNEEEKECTMVLK